MLALNRLGVGLLAMATAIMQAQSFTSIQVKPAHSADLQSRRVRILPSGDLIATSVNAIGLISDGYGVPANPSERLSDLPPWVSSERFDIEAKASSSARRVSPFDGNDATLVRDMFRQVLVDALIVARGGAKLKQEDFPDCIFDTAQSGCHSFLGGFGHPLNARAVDMDDLAHYIENWTDLPVVNRTSLTGVFTMSTEGWRPMRLPPPPPNGVGNVDFTHLQTIDTVLGGLGLELHKEVATVPIFNVDQIQRP
jgi:uncharacterized protein (TIGR03435 family)